MRRLITLMMLFFFRHLDAQVIRPHSLGFNAGGLADTYDIHSTFRLYTMKHQLQLGFAWKPVSTKRSYHTDFVYLNVPVQYQYHFFISYGHHFDLNAGIQIQYTLSPELPDQIKITPAAGIAYTKNLGANCYFIRGGILVFAPYFFTADRYEAFGYKGKHWLYWPVLGIGKYLN